RSRTSWSVARRSPRSRTWHASIPWAASATAAAGDRFSSSRSLTGTRTTDARIRGRELLREFDVLRIEIRVVLENVLHRGAPQRHRADVANREPTIGEHGLAAEDVIAGDELLLPPCEPLDASLHLANGSGQLHLEIRSELDAPRRPSLGQRGGDEAIELSAVVHAEVDAEGGDGEQVHDLRECEARRAFASVEHAMLDVLADPAFVEPEQRD